jgi:DNA-binding MarR family transcriptional regulator
VSHAGNGRRNGGPATRGPRDRRGAGDARRLLRLLNALGTATVPQLLWRSADALDLTVAQARALFHVERHPGCHMGDLATAFGVTLPAATHVVDRLEQKGLVRRAADPRDRRACLLALSAAGTALVRELERLQLGALEAVVGRLSPAARRRAVAGLTVLVEANGGGVRATPTGRRLAPRA